MRRQKCTSLIVFALLIMTTFVESIAAQYILSETEPLFGDWISPRWDSPPKGSFIQNEGFGKIVFSAEMVEFYRKSTDHNDIGTDRYSVIAKHIDKENNTWYRIVFFATSNTPWYYIFKISASGSTCEYLCAFYDQEKIWTDMKNGVFTDWRLYRSSDSNSFDTIYRK